LSPLKQSWPAGGAKVQFTCESFSLYLDRRGVVPIVSGEAGSKNFIGKKVRSPFDASPQGRVWNRTAMQQCNRRHFPPICFSFDGSKVPLRTPTPADHDPSICCPEGQQGL